MTAIMSEANHRGRMEEENYFRAKFPQGFSGNAHLG
jgi:hypothetical protein